MKFIHSVYKDLVKITVDTDSYIYDSAVEIPLEHIVRKVVLYRDETPFRFMLFVEKCYVHKVTRCLVFEALIPFKYIVNTKGHIDSLDISNLQVYLAQIDYEKTIANRYPTMLGNASLKCDIPTTMLFLQKYPRLA